MSNKAIASQLGISPRTVEGHINHVFDKIGASSRTELVHVLSGQQPVRPRTSRGHGIGSVNTVRTAGTDASESSEHSSRPIVSRPVHEPEEASAGEGPPSRHKADRTPWNNSQFWILQLIILALYLIRLAATVAFHLDADSQGVEFSTLALSRSGGLRHAQLRH